MRINTPTISCDICGKTIPTDAIYTNSEDQTICKECADPQPKPLRIRALQTSNNKADRTIEIWHQQTIEDAARLTRRSEEEIRMAIEEFGGFDTDFHQVRIDGPWGIRTGTEWVGCDPDETWTGDPEAARRFLTQADTAVLLDEFEVGLEDQIDSQIVADRLELDTKCPICESPMVISNRNEATNAYTLTCTNTKGPGLLCGFEATIDPERDESEEIALAEATVKAKTESKEVE